MVGPKNTLFLDEISTGLDSSTTFLIVRCVRNFVHTLQVRPCALSPFPCAAYEHTDLRTWHRVSLVAGTQYMFSNFQLQSYSATKL